MGFRPFVHRLAVGMNLPGWVLNAPEGVFIEVEGAKKVLDTFLIRLEKEKPAHAFIQSIEASYLDPIQLQDFRILASKAGGDRMTLVLPDIASCEECMAEVSNTHDRRYRYPFTNCTHCGPRFTIIEALPYDRKNTTMRNFTMCGRCRAEYEDPLDRRFHAQPIACPECGPHIELWDPDGKAKATCEAALTGAADEIRKGAIVAVKGLGGFHLMVDARNEEAVIRLRMRKQREEKPLALMFPTMAAIVEHCEVSPMEERLLRAPESPIVLLKRLGNSHAVSGGLSSRVAPRNPFLGVMLPYTPLHHLLLNEVKSPVIATSGNLSEEPICTDEREALERLPGIADLFLVHDRPIARHVDDSIVRIMLDRELVLRRARGYAPLPMPVKPQSEPILAVGGHLKNTITLAARGNAFISQHIGDLENKESLEAFGSVIRSLETLYDAQPVHIAADLHPDYLSTRFAGTLGLHVSPIQHHFAHVASCMTDNGLEETVLGVSWDGTGFGPDHTIWGGEFLLADLSRFVRFASLRKFMLPGGERAIKEPRRAALGVLFEIFGDDVFTWLPQPVRASYAAHELTALRQMLAGGVNSPFTSSAGRLFDAVAALSGLRQRVHFEGQAAMELEFAIAGEASDDVYPFGSAGSEPLVVDWEPMIRAILDDLREEIPIEKISGRFHNTLADIIVAIARRAGLPKVLLTGGCFQNKYLTERTVRQLGRAGFSPYWHQRIPPNDGGISLGQAAIVAHRLGGSGIR